MGDVKIEAKTGAEFLWGASGYLPDLRIVKRKVFKETPGTFTIQSNFSGTNLVRKSEMSVYDGRFFLTKSEAVRDAHARMTDHAAEMTAKAERAKELLAAFAAANADLLTAATPDSSADATDGGAGEVGAYASVG